jgi:hypothetical protein
VNILVRNPADAAQLSAKLAEAFADAEALEALPEEDRKQIHRLMTLIEQMEE